MPTPTNPPSTQRNVTRSSSASSSTHTPERKLAYDYGIAPMTVRRALDQLAEEGLVVAQQGRGHFVQDPDDAGRPADGKSVRELLDESTRQLEEAIRALDEANARLDALEAGGADPGVEPPVDPGPDRSPGIDL